MLATSLASSTTSVRHPVPTTQSTAAGLPGVRVAGLPTRRVNQDLCLHVRGPLLKCHPKLETQLADSFFGFRVFRGGWASFYSPSGTGRQCCFVARCGIRRGATVLSGYEICQTVVISSGSNSGTWGGAKISFPLPGASCRRRCPRRLLDGTWYHKHVKVRARRGSFSQPRYDWRNPALVFQTT